MKGKVQNCVGRCGVRKILGHLTLRSPSFLAFGLLALASMVSRPTCAQVAGATLSGTVRDPSSAVIPNAQVAIRNVTTAVTRTVTTDTAGLYTAPNLLPGEYSITVAATGFSRQVQSGVTLTVGAQQVLNFNMQVGQVSETVQVVTEAPAVQLTSSEISGVVNATTVRELPLNGRSWTDLASLQPGVADIQTQASYTVQDRGNRGFGAQVTISGGRPQQNNYRLDGISINDYTNGAPGSVIGGNLGVDSIQEFSVLTSNYAAEYGKTSGGVVNAITRSATNQFHGTAYEFLRNSALDARNFFDVGAIPPFKRNQFGADAGGPIRKDRTFIFGDYEGIRQSKGITSLSTVPSADARNGILTFPGGPTTFPNYDSIGHPELDCVATGVPNQCKVPVDPAVQKFLGLYPLPLTSTGNTGTFTFAGQQIVNENFVTTRLDQKFSENDSIYGTYLFDKTNFNAPDNFDDKLIGSFTKRQFFVVEETHMFGPGFLNTVRFGINRESVNNNQGLKAINPLAGNTAVGGVPGHDAPAVSVGGINQFTGGEIGAPSWEFRWTELEAYDDAFLTKGLHSIKFGVAFERIRHNQDEAQGSGNFFFGSLPQFLTNQPSRFDSFLSNVGTTRDLRQILFGVYAQDDWRLRPNLTLNLGLRYEMTTVPTEVHNRLSNLLNLSDATPHLGSPFFMNPTLRNFEPRVGFSWDPLNTGKTAVRGGFGIFDVLPLPYQFLSMVGMSAPFRELGTIRNLPAGAFFTGAFNLLSPASLQQEYIQHDPHRNYVMQWNLNIQREITPSLTALAGYVGSRGVHQPFRADDLNVVVPTLTSAGYLFPSPVGSGTNVNPSNGDIRGVMYGGGSAYHALEVGVLKNMSHGFQMQGSFTWAKSIDTSSAVVFGDGFQNSIASLSWWNMKLSRALSDFNIGRTLVINTTWQVPSVKSASGPLAWVTNGWELGAVFKVEDGVPFTPTWGTDGDPQGLNSSDPWAFPNRLGGPNCATLTNPGNPNHYIKTECFAVPTASNETFFSAAPPLGCDPAFGSLNPKAPNYLWCFNLRGNAGRNILIGPGTTNLDFSIFKNNHIKRISESFNAQFRAEFFNILNHANFHTPVVPDNTDIFDSTGTPTGVAGLLTSTTTTAREIQFALKLSW